MCQPGCRRKGDSSRDFSRRTEKAITSIWVRLRPRVISERRVFKRSQSRPSQAREARDDDGDDDAAEADPKPAHLAGHEAATDVTQTLAHPDEPGESQEPGDDKNSRFQCAIRVVAL